MFYKRIAYISVVGNHQECQGFPGYQRDLGDRDGLVVLCVQVVLDDLVALGETDAFVKERKWKTNVRKHPRIIQEQSPQDLIKLNEKQIIIKAKQYRQTMPFLVIIIIKNKKK